MVTNAVFSLDEIKDDVLENSNNSNSNFDIAIDLNTVNYFCIF